ncbi:MAG: cyclase family protein [Firmicutes bacterium]|nr:cyclase family protein [Bacillota bacterium]
MMDKAKAQSKTRARARAIDVTVAIEPGMPVFPGDPPVQLRPALRIAAGDVANVSFIYFGSHTGTHVDPPCHFIEGGKTVDELDVEMLLGPAYVCDCRKAGGQVTAKDLAQAGIPAGASRVLIRTRNSELWGRGFTPDFTELSSAAADWLVERGFRLVGFDYLSVERGEDRNYPVHRKLLGDGVIILEGLNLAAVAPGRMYQMACLPLRIKGGDGAPARVVLTPSA